MMPVSANNYPDFVKYTGYGTGGGLAGWNCRHNFIPFNPETMTNNLKQYGLEENQEMYENHQKQRYYERNIRKYKRLSETEKTALNSASDDETRTKFQEKYNKHKMLALKWTKAYEKFSTDNNLRTQPERMKI